MSDSPSRKKNKTQKGWRLDSELLLEFEKFCLDRGWSVTAQVEIALKDWLVKSKAREGLEKKITPSQRQSHELSG